MSLTRSIKTALPAGAPSGAADASDMSRINAFANPPLSAEQVYVFPCVVCNAEYRKDLPWRFGESSLKNFAANCENGIPYHIMHDRAAYNGGFTFGGHYDAQTKECRAAVYIVKGFPLGEGRTTDTEIAAIQSGLRRAVSVGPAGRGRWVCDLCNEDVYGEICPHLPGRTYEGKLCTATVEDLQAIEVSGVDVGAVPGALILKAQQQYATHALEANAFTDWLHQMQVSDTERYLTPPATTITPPAPINDGGTGKPKETKPMREKLAAALSRLGLTTLAAAVIGAKEDDADNLAERLSAQVGEEVKAQVATHPLIIQLAASNINTVDALNTLVKEAEQGRAALTDAQSELTKAAVRLFGQATAEQMAAAYKHLPMETVKATASQWNKDADTKFGTSQSTPAPRQTAPTQLPNLALPAGGQGEDEHVAAMRAETKKLINNGAKGGQ